MRGTDQFRRLQAQAECANVNLNSERFIFDTAEIVMPKIMKPSYVRATVSLSELTTYVNDNHWIAKYREMNAGRSDIKEATNFKKPVTIAPLEEDEMNATVQELWGFLHRHNFESVLFWQWGEGALVDKPVEKCLQEFLKLEASKSNVHKFVEQWGPLNFCLTRSWHSRDYVVLSAYGPDMRTAWHSEDVDIYRELAHSFAILIEITQVLRMGRVVSRNMWQEAVWMRDLSDDDWRVIGNHNDHQRQYLASLLTQMMLGINTGSSVQWTGSHPSVVLTWKPSTMPGSYNLYPLLVSQLVAAIRSPNGIYRCDICGTMYTPQNRKGRGDGKRLCSEECRLENHRENAKLSKRRRSAKSPI